jgi:hypothetical protein
MKTSSDVRIATPSPDSTPRESVATKAMSITIVSVRTPVRFVIYPWIATVTQGQTDSIDGERSLTGEVVLGDAPQVRP